MRRENLIHPLRHSEERPMRRGNLIHPSVILRSVLCDVRISLFKVFMKKGLKG
jgi:hypothetical protein